MLVVTIACSDKMAQTANSYEMLYGSLVSTLEDARRQIGDNELIVCMNVHANSIKVKSASNEEVHYAMWQKYVDEDAARDDILSTEVANFKVNKNLLQEQRELRKRIKIEQLI